MSQTIYVTHGYSEEFIWREALGPEVCLFVHAQINPTIDAPEAIPAGSTVEDLYAESLPRKFWREG